MPCKTDTYKWGGDVSKTETKKKEIPATSSQPQSKTNNNCETGEWDTFFVFYKCMVEAEPMNLRIMNLHQIHQCSKPGLITTKKLKSVYIKIEEQKRLNTDIDNGEHSLRNEAKS